MTRDHAIEEASRMAHNTEQGAAVVKITGDHYSVCPLEESEDWHPNGEIVEVVRTDEQAARAAQL